LFSDRRKGKERKGKERKDSERVAYRSGLLCIGEKERETGRGRERESLSQAPPRHTQELRLWSKVFLEGEKNFGVRCCV
jgi:hypothetical protein